MLTPYRNGGDPYAAGQHRGIDIGARVGTPVVAAQRGTVVYAGVAGSSGLTVAERTADGRFELSYLHLSAAAVHAGERVGAGDRIGVVGTSGTRSAEAPHLHFGIRLAGDRHAYRDPLDFLGTPPAGAPEPRPVPAPVPAREPVGPEPAPAGQAAAAPASEPAAVPSAAPAPSGLPAGSPGPVFSGHPIAGGVGEALAAPGRSPASGALRGTVHAPGGATSSRADVRSAEGAGSQANGHGRDPLTPTPGTGPGSAVAASGTGGAGARAANRRTGSQAASGGGIDIGWLAACLGLVAAATMLGHPQRTRDAAARGRAGVLALLRPLSRQG